VNSIALRPIAALTPVRFYNTLTQRTEDFAPLDDATVRMYSGGPTGFPELSVGDRYQTVTAFPGWCDSGP
jgi:hypothetical protein